jgi:hypothetical protein
METGNESLKSNRLSFEKSPYLLQHANNPVHWFAWEEVAFQAALREDKPIFLSVGYSTCHWCHVMAHESFEDQAVADILNQTFICIKVDREERPDIDQMYMKAAQAMTGRGGWPLTIIMTPEKKPFFAATYIPKTGRFGQAGMMEIIPRIKELWENNREELLDHANRIFDHLRRMEPDQTKAQDAGEEVPVSMLLERGYAALSSIYDNENGGFGTAPKFPSPSNLLFLLRYWHRTHEEFALKMVEKTLQAMRRSGIYDHVGFGFHRYSTDKEWLVPHFEKMLYDQALLTTAYTEAYQATGKKEYAKTAQEIIEYVQRVMTSEDGGFFTAEDADSDGEEGKYYIWSAEELKEILDEEEFRHMIRLFDIYESGNFENGKNIIRERPHAFSASVTQTIEKDKDSSRDGMLEGIRSKLFAARENRTRPMKDDKILTDGNGLMIAALCKASQTLDEPKYAKAAMNAADFILKEMQTDEGRLLHRYRGEAGIAGILDDYAFFVWGLIEIYETVFDAKYLKAALHLNWVMIQHFWDEDNGGFFFNADDLQALPLRQKELYDGAIPSGSSVAMLNLLRLMHISGNAELGDKAWQLARSSYSAIKREPLGHTMMLSSLDYALGPASEITIVGCPEDTGTIEMLRALRSRFLPSNSVILACGDEIRDLAPFTKNLEDASGRTRAYVCTSQSCSLAATSPEMMMQMIDNKK